MKLPDPVVQGQAVSFWVSAEIVRRHVNLVYSTALRQVRSHELAEEVVRSVFVSLAQNIGRLAPDTILSAWLYTVANRTAANVVRRKVRRELREQTASEMDSMNTTTADWTHIEPLLDEAMDALGNADRTAVLLRYFEFVICISIAGLTVPLSFTENAGRQLQKRFSIWRSRRSSTGQIAL